MNELDNKINLEVKVSKTFEVADGAGVSKATVNLTPLEASIQARKHDLNFPALQSMFELNEAELKAILDKLPPTENCNC